MMSQFVLRVLWLEKSIGIAVDQQIGSKTHPVTEYCFWPRNDAWDSLKELLDKNPWVPKAESVILLNQAAELIQYIQTEDGKSSMKKMQEEFSDCLFVGHN